MGVPHAKSMRKEVFNIIANTEQPFSIRHINQLLPHLSERGIKSSVYYLNRESFIKPNGEKDPNDAKFKLYEITKKGKEFFQKRTAEASNDSNSEAEVSMGQDFYNDPENIKRAMKAMTTMVIKIVDDYNKLKRQLSALSK